MGLWRCPPLPAMVRAKGGSARAAVPVLLLFRLKIPRMWPGVPCACDGQGSCMTIIGLVKERESFFSATGQLLSLGS